MTHQAIPLSAPDGTIYAWACGLCKHIGSGGERWCNHDAELIAETARDSWRSAVDCCRCRSCGGVNDKDNSAGDALHCSTCKPVKDAEFAEMRERASAKHAAHDLAVDASLTKAKSEDAAHQLLELMRDISEDYYCASWMNGLEFTLWEAVNCDINSEIRIADADSLRFKNEQAGGWWIWSDNAGGEIFVTTEEWLEIFGKRGES